MITKVKVRGYRIYRYLEINPNPKLNIFVGANESGKTTLMEAIGLALTGRLRGRWAAEELNPYWFNVDEVKEFVEQRQNGNPVDWPKIHIEVYLEDRDELQRLCGALNTDLPTNACPGMSIEIFPNPEYAEELEEWVRDATALLPVEYYKVEWRSFAGDILTTRPKQLATAIIDSSTVRTYSGVDYHMRQILSDRLEPAESAAISLAYRKVKESMSNDALKRVNERMAEAHAALHNEPITLAMDQSARTSWEGVVVPHVNEIPFNMSGQGQQAAVKIALAMARQSERASVVMVEEPENHLSHTSLLTLLSRIQSLTGESQQLFVSTHSSFVLNRLGLDALHLFGGNASYKITGLSADTVAYFKKLSGYDTLRMALADKLVLVEGPSDEIIFERIFWDKYRKRPIELGIDVLSVHGLSFARCLELCAALDKKVAVLRDNDGRDPDELREPLQDWLADGMREMFIGEVGQGETLEPQIVSYNGETKIRSILGIKDNVDIFKWMERKKTESALRIAEAEESIEPPAYIRKAAEFIHG